LPQQFQPTSSTSRQQTPFDLSSLSQHISPQPQHRPQVQQWAGQFQPQLQPQESRRSPAQNWAHDFHPSQAAVQDKGKGRQYEPEMTQPYMPTSKMGMGMGMGMPRPYMPPANYASQSLQQPQSMREPTAQDFDEAEALVADSQKEQQTEVLSEPISEENGEGPNFDL
jgi:hypothetical protein